MKNIALLFLCYIFPSILYSQENYFPELTGSYLGQKPPGMISEPFAKNIPLIHRFLHSGIIFSPDGNEAYWKPDWNPGSPIMFSKVEEGVWTLPQAASFSQPNQGDDSPFISPDGKRFFFLSQRAQKHKESIWVMKRTPQGWSEPEIVSEISNSLNFIHWQFSVDSRGNLYFGAGEKGDGKGGYIYCSIYINGKYGPPEKLSPEINEEGRYNYSPCISPDGSTIIFTRDQNPAILYVSFREKNENWSKAKELNTILNCRNCLNPVMTADGKYLFYLAGGYPYWVSLKVLEGLRPKK